MNAPDIFALGGDRADHPATAEEPAAIEFEPIDTTDVMRKGLSAKSVQALAVNLRLAAVTVRKTKAELIEMVHSMSANGNEDAFFEMVDCCHDTIGRLKGMLEMAEAAHARCLSAASVVAIADEGSAS
jgi:hypothetical protein